MTTTRPDRPCVDCGEMVPQTGKRGPFRNRCEPHRAVRRAAEHNQRKQERLADPVVRAAYIARVRAWQKAHPEWRSTPARQMAERKHYHTRRNLKVATYEPYTSAQIVARDGAVCWLCDDAIDLELVWPDPMSLSMDHVVPLSHQGPDTPANVRPAHLTCNCSRGNRARSAA